ncbi:MAG: DUF11 domain-containing protein [Ramlibacter sp.]|nr:DUF11 domain-containing protein [Ramlibacter sp.]
MFMGFLWALCACQGAWAQASACDANENLVTFVFGTTRSTSATGGTGTWTSAALGPFSFGVGTSTGAITANTVTFQASIDGASSWSAPGGTAPNAPRLANYGGFTNSLALAMTGTTAGFGTHLTLNFSRPMDKLRLIMGDVDYSANNWQDVLRVTGSLNGNTVIAPGMTVGTPANFAIATNSPSAGTTEVTALAAAGNCAGTSAACNVTVTFANPVDSVQIDFIAGNPGINPSVGQVVGFQNFSYCVPRRDLSMVKVDTTPTFVAGNTGTYTLTITNQGGTQTLAASPILVQDQLPQGLSFISPQSPGGGWSCTISTTTFASDTVDCNRGTTVLAGNGASTVLTLTVSVSPDVTATSVDNVAKVAGGGDPNKAAITTTGPLSSCNASNEGWDGGGASGYASGGTTNAGCAFENTLISRQALLTITKTNNTSTVTSGGTTIYVITVVNSGPSSAPGTRLTDSYALGLSCSTPTFTSTPLGSVTITPTVPTISDLQGTGIFLTPTFPPNTTATFSVPCTITATGQLTPDAGEGLTPLLASAGVDTMMGVTGVTPLILTSAAILAGEPQARRATWRSWAGAPSGTPSGPPGSGGSSG